MKNIILVYISFFLISCSSRSEDVIKTLDVNKTEVTGKVYDFQRNVPVPNYLVSVKREYRDYCGYASCIKTEQVASVRSDQNGFYRISFDYVKDPNKQDLVYFIKVENSDGYIAERINNSIIDPLKNNVQDINAWKPITAKFNLKVSNNANPPLYVATLLTPESGTFNSGDVAGNGNVSVELLAKPSSLMYVNSITLLVEITV
ncbi:hypothetical protein [Kaistella jeonii]|uniref:Lipoprotein n=1 Tax=Kaistella jeonii TaxID=266749 RepID=A0A0C1FM60_9FLAO|nr:hypothetical protein [Kaistella jeonii]KIA89019.1 hypothetical protein OA86_08050 [Kaistella jeonii]SFB96433.1 hypothetical protein SAMN05421876_104156 [Kaistella jeonii]VEI97183.1 Uncharacterised protein [Kaistella jeonii]